MFLSVKTTFMENKIFKRLMKSNLAVAIILNTFFLLLALIFCDFKYEVSDDFIMASIMSGAYGDEPNPHLIFVNVILGYFLLPFYKMIPQVSWYFVLQILTIFISSISVSCLLFKRVNRWLATLLSIMLILFFANDALILVQFTKTAAFSVMSGSVVFLDALFEYKKKINIVWGAILCLIGVMIRFSTIYIAAGYILLIILYETIFLIKSHVSKKQKIRRLSLVFMSGIILIAISYLGDAVNRYSYHNNEEYNYFYEFTSARSGIVDYPDYGYDMYASELQELGISENDYYMLKTWNFYDPENFDLEKLEKVVSVIRNKGYSRDDSWEALIEYLQGRKITEYPAFLACVIIFFLVLFFNYKQYRIILMNFGIAIALLLYFSYRERLIYRIEYSVLLCAFISSIYFFSKIRHNEMDKTENYFYISKKVCLNLIIVVFAWNAIIYIPDNTYKKIDSSERKNYIEETFYNSWDYNVLKYRRVVNKNKPANELIQEFEENKENIYFLDFNTTIQTLYYEWNPWKSKPLGEYNNFFYLGGIDSYFPDQLEKLEEKGIYNPLKSLTEENVYLIDNNYLELKLNYLREHYYPNAKAELYKEINGYQIWKIYEE